MAKFANGHALFPIARRPAISSFAASTDHRLGDGLTGVAMAEEIKRRTGRAFPTLVLTGDTVEECAVETNAHGFEMLHKPVARGRPSPQAAHFLIRRDRRRI